MIKEYLKNRWRKLDNTAKIFSLEADENINIFRYSVILKKGIDKEILRKALKATLEKYSGFKVKSGTGFFWNYLEYNSKEAIVSEEDNIPCQLFDFKDNNDYLFKVTYYRNKINLDIFHVLTDGTGAIRFLKELVYNYLSLKHKNKVYDSKEIIEYKDQYLENFDKKCKAKYDCKKAFQIKGKSEDVNNSYHYTVSVSDIKKIAKGYGMSITEYLTALYIYAMYTSIYDGRSGRDIVLNVPINLRKYYNVDTMSNFFVCMNIGPNLVDNNVTTLEEAIELVHDEYKKKLSFEQIKGYLYKGVRLGQNLPIRLVPLFIKKVFINCACKIIGRTATSTLSNVGIVDIDEKYKKYIDNVYVLVLPGKVQKIKCTVCSYDDKLNITVNSNIDDMVFEKRFYELLKDSVKKVKVITNTNIDFK